MSALQQTGIQSGPTSDMDGALLAKKLLEVVGREIAFNDNKEAARLVNLALKGMSA